jgi:5'-nucleotidase / UDP-sugar diphosphatase
MLFLIALLACQPHPVPVADSVSDVPGHLVIAHTNDTHAHFEPNRAGWISGAPDIGGFAEIAGVVSALHAEEGDDHVLYLDGGDIMTGTPLMEFEARGVRGGAMLDFMETAGLDAWVLGNHEFDIGLEHISGVVNASRIPVLSANLDALDGTGAPGILGLQDHTIFERNGLKVGVFGLTTASLGRLTASGAAEGLRVRSVIDAAREQVATLEPRVDLVVALTHIGLDMDRTLAQQVDGIDLIVGGHSHTPLTSPVKESNTWIVQAGCYSRQLGITEMIVEDGRITTFSAELRDLIPGSTPVHQASADLARIWTERIDAHFSIVVGQLEGGNLDRPQVPETPLGRWAADTLRHAAKTDLGVYNPGGLRADLIAGPITRGAFYNVFPFGNAVVHFELTGAELIGLLIRNATSEISAKHPVMQLSGVTAQWRTRVGVPELVEVRVGGALLDPAATYTMATNSYIAAQWKYNLGFDPGELVEIGMTAYEAAIARAGEGNISPPTDARMLRVD